MYEPQVKFASVESLLLDDDPSSSDGSPPMSLARVVRATEANILGASDELKSIVIESGEMAESLFETVNDGYKELTAS
jgi:hypothetical protein